MLINYMLYFTVQTKLWYLCHGYQTSLENDIILHSILLQLFPQMTMAFHNNVGTFFSLIFPYYK